MLVIYLKLRKLLKKSQEYDFEKGELLEDYSQTTGKVIGEQDSKITITNKFFTKNTPNDKTKGFFFTENLQAYLYARNRMSEVNELPRQNKDVKLNVTANNNQAGIRTDKNGNINKKFFCYY